MTAKKAVKKDEAPLFYPDQFFNNGDWPLFRRIGYVRVKHQEDGSILVVHPDLSHEIIDEDTLFYEYEPVKGPHKAEF